MGHHADPNKYAAYRDAIVLQRRIATFVLVFTVVIIALVMTFSAVQYREARCQDRAHEIAFEFMVRPDATREDIVVALQSVMQERHGSLDFLPQNDDASKTVQLEVLDTPAGYIGSRGFRLLRRSDGSNFHYELRAIFEKLCGSYPTISMEVMPNVDYERVTYHIRAMARTGSRVKYMQQSSLLTKDSNRVTTVPQLQALFPGFREFGPSTARLSSKQSAKYTIEGVSEAYYSGSPLDISVTLQCWYTEKGKPAFWRVVLGTQNIMAERNLVSLEHSVQLGLAQRSLLCNATSDCGGLDEYLR